jgi:molybdopterin-binding protein
LLADTPEVLLRWLPSKWRDVSSFGQIPDPSGQSPAVRCTLQRMTLSARNKLVGKIAEIQFGGVMAHVTIKAGNATIESVITKRSVEEMKLKVGDTVKAVIKSTEVMLEKD